MKIEAPGQPELANRKFLMKVEWKINENRGLASYAFQNCEVFNKILIENQ